MAKKREGTPASGVPQEQQTGGEAAERAPGAKPGSSARKERTRTGENARADAQAKGPSRKKARSGEAADGENVSSVQTARTGGSKPSGAACGTRSASGAGRGARSASQEGASRRGSSRGGSAHDSSSRGSSRSGSTHDSSTRGGFRGGHSHGDRRREGNGLSERAARIVAYSPELLLEGVLDGNKKGFAFLRPDPKYGRIEDVFVPPRALHGALHRDEVVVAVTDGDRREGEVVEIKKRGFTQVAGTFERTANFAFVVPDDKRYFRDVFIPQPGKKVRDGQKVVAELTKFSDDGKSPEGRVIEVLGDPGRESDLLAIIRTYHLREDFPDEVQAAARTMPQEVSPAECRGRRDFTAERIVTIDGVDTRDIDDAVTVRKNDDGTFTLGVHIADVSHYVTEGSTLDVEAYKRGTSAYFPDRVLPMLPRELSNGICSLNEGELRLTMSCVMRIDQSGDVLSHELCEGFIRSTHRMTYDEVTALIEDSDGFGGKYDDVRPMMKQMAELFEVLSRRRTRRGSIDMDMPEFRIVAGENGEIIDIVPQPRTISHRIIEEFMIVTNETVAEHMHLRELPFLYRVHEIPDPEKVEDFAKYVSGFGLKLSGNLEKISPSDYLRLLDDARESPYYNVINRVMLRTMMKARYSAENLGHFGISSKCYCHFTSPIRRYPDLFIHRVIREMAEGTLDKSRRNRFKAAAVEAAVHCSETERAAELAEREVDDYLKAEYMAHHIGEEFDGIISSVKDFGFFVELPNTIEGLVRVESLHGTYVYDEKRLILTGTDHVYRLGEAVRIRVDAAGVETRKIDFSLVK